MTPQFVHALAGTFAFLLPSVSSCAEPPDVANTSALLAAGYGIPKITLSPNKQYGVSAIIDLKSASQSRAVDFHGVYEIETGRLIGKLGSRPWPLHANHGSILPARWSADSSLLLWRTSGKWADWALELIKIRDGQIAWQLDVLDAAQTAILERTEHAAPEAYRLKKEENKGNGEAYPEGFTVFISTLGDDKATVKLPIQVSVALTSNPKRSGLPDDPASSDPSCLESKLEATVDVAGKFSVTEFRLLQNGRRAK